ncbi:hypothetical protein AX16_008399 [Volvariella volvacea WC 439]|nr:hypothetical protein AX16_008399 [Volvariella volvacea WC 439]
MASVTASLFSTTFMTPRASRSNMNSTTSHAQQQQQQRQIRQPQLVQQPEEEEGDEAQQEEQFTSFFCRALYDYEAQDASALSFRQNDIIEVLSQQPSGWWDGLLGDNRGWFPSNYVSVITEEEAELALEGADFGTTRGQAQQQQPENQAEDPAVVDMSHAMMRGHQSEPEDWSDNELAMRAGVQALSNAGRTKDKASDFWVPQVGQDGRIFYVNTQTGQHSRDIPQEVEDEASDGDFAGLTSQSSSRSGTSAGLGFASSDSEASSSVPNAAGFGVLRRSGTPEPWVRKLADDGMAYYYYNKLDGSIQWTRPEPVHSEQQHLINNEHSQRPGIVRSNSVYSDDSDVQPLEHNILADHRMENRRRRRPSVREEEPIIMQLTSAEKIAQSLQKALAPSPAELVTDLSNIARNAIQAVVESIQANGLIRRPEQDKRMDSLIHGAVDAVRNLLYVVTSPSGHIPSNVLPPEAGDYTPNPIHASLKLVQRRVTATLSRLVLSARAIQYDSGSSVVDTLHKIEVDAEELERAVLSFVLEVQRVQHASEDGRAPKRLKGVFDTANIGLGLVGAGAAGEWKGFGWVASDESIPPPQTLLRGEALAEIDSRITQIDALFKGLLQVLQATEDGAIHQTRLRSQQVISHLNAFLSYVADIHVARHIDVDGIRQEAGSTASDAYLQTVSKARALTRTLEASVQAVFDDSSLLLSFTQKIFEYEPGLGIVDQDALQEQFVALSASLRSNLGVVRQTLKALFTIGNDQAEMDQGDYNGSIEWRITRLSFIDNRFGGAIRLNSPTFESEQGGEDVVDMEQAFSNAPRPRHASEATYGTPSIATENTYVEGSHRHHHQSMASDATAMAPSTSADTIGEDYDSEDELPRPPIRKSKSGKLVQILGEDYPTKPATPPPPPQPEPQPWYLQPNYDPSEILIDSDNSVKGGTVPALVERLTAHEQADPTFVKSFLMTYKSFTTLNELFDLLVARFKIQPPDGLAPTELEHWRKMKQHVIQMRVLNTLKSMVVDEDFLEKEDIYILDRMKDFIMSEEVAKFAAAKQLKILIDRLQQGQDAIPRTLVSQGPPPQPILPKAGKKLKLLEIEPLELARQLTIMESHLYQKIKPMECLQRAREQRTENMDNIAFVIQTSNRIADWVAESVLSKDDSRRRAAVVKHLIMVADRCRSLNNFSTMIAITSGLNTPPIRRLKRTWEQVNQRTMAQFAACEMTIDSNKNFTKYRQLMQNVTPPCVPFIGVFLSTLQFIQDGNPDTLPGNLVNFRKRQKASEVIQDIKRWQAQPFNFQPVESILTFIEESLSQFTDTRATSDYFWQLSLEREPREREDERMARLLQESGFL